MGGMLTSAHAPFDARRRLDEFGQTTERVLGQRPIVAAFFCNGREVWLTLESLGRHILVEFYGCDLNTLNNASVVKEYMEEAATAARATIVNSFIHKFNPYGVSGVVVIAESHLTIHTWPEYGYAAVDLFTCGDDVNPWTCYEVLTDRLKAKLSTTIELRRGTLDTPHLRHKPQA